MSQQPIAGPEDLTPLERRYLQNLWDYCKSSPTLAMIYAKSWRNTCVLLLITGLVIAAGLLWESPFAAWFIGGITTGALLRDLGYFRQTIRLWRATETIIDRQKLDELVADPPDANYS
ncbi:hypothetical protein J8F10_29500 [Gemmata sp. G18]|uniref:DUF4231 domain-containing protein n=1 Tax=Gemmata palustris TaxID=2822762 RepID=A0ABS5C093_9BACT|nr:hypothetical protein [Gemmata palustris]MBP3959399.1 hypothetical protein [Gemmata palustris]